MSRVLKRSQVWLALMAFSAIAWVIALSPSTYFIRFDLPILNYLFFAMVCAGLPISLWFSAKQFQRKFTKWCAYLLATCLAIPAFPASAFSLVQSIRLLSNRSVASLSDDRLLKKISCHGETFSLHYEAAAFMLVDDYFRLKRDKKLPGMTLSQHLFAHEVRVPNEAIQPKSGSYPDALSG